MLSDLDEEEHTRPSGPEILDDGIGLSFGNHVNLLNVFKSDAKMQTVSYHNDMRIFIQAEEFLGDIEECGKYCITVIVDWWERMSPRMI